jgi:hypothetical protein
MSYIVLSVQRQKSTVPAHLQKGFPIFFNSVLHKSLKVSKGNKNQLFQKGFPIFLPKLTPAVDLIYLYSGCM